MNQRVKIGNLTIDVFFNEYNKKNKTRRQIEGHQVSKYDMMAIDRGLDDTDFGEFYRFENCDIEVTGMFNVIDARENELG
jgi:hypothetical protein